MGLWAQAPQPAETRPSNGGQRLRLCGVRPPSPPLHETRCLGKRQRGGPDKGEGPAGGGNPLIRRATRAAWLALADLGAGWSTRQSPSLTRRGRRGGSLNLDRTCSNGRLLGTQGVDGISNTVRPGIPNTVRPLGWRGRRLHSTPWLVRAPATPGGERQRRLCSCCPAHRAATAALGSSHPPCVSNATPPSLSPAGNSSGFCSSTRRR